jgi:hypothetical protein
MPKLKPVSPAAKNAIHQAVRDERSLWESRRPEDGARRALASPRRAKETKKRERAIETLDRIQQELWDIDKQFFPLSKPLLAAVAEPFGRTISKLMAPDEHAKLETEPSLGDREPHREPQCPVLMRTLSRLYDQRESLVALVRYALHETDLLQIPSADGLTEETLRERLRKRKKPSTIRKKS